MNTLSCTFPAVKYELDAYGLRCDATAERQAAARADDALAADLGWAELRAMDARFFSQGYVAAQLGVSRAVLERQQNVGMAQFWHPLHLAGWDAAQAETAMPSAALARTEVA